MNFSLFDDCFSGATDVDMAVEKDKGRFLFCEFKDPNAFLDKGQVWFFDHLAAIPRVTVVVAWGRVDLDEPNPFIEHMRHWGVENTRRAVDIDGLRDFMRRWSNREWE